MSPKFRGICRMYPLLQTCGPFRPLKGTVSSIFPKQESRQTLRFLLWLIRPVYQTTTAAIFWESFLCCDARLKSRADRVYHP